jgi:hypothetical protein
MSTGYNRRACKRCGNDHFRRTGLDLCLTCAPVAPCKNCGARRIVETITEECAKCDRRGQIRYEEKRKAARQKEAAKSALRYARDRKTGAQHRVGYTDTERKAQKVRCTEGCHDLPWRRPLKGKCKCGKVWEAEPEPGRASVLGSAMGAVGYLHRG